MEGKMMNVRVDGKVIATVEESQLELKKVRCNVAFQSEGITELYCDCDDFDISILQDKKRVIGVFQEFEEREFLCYVTEATKEDNKKWSLVLLVVDEQIKIK